MHEKLDYRLGSLIAQGWSSQVWTVKNLGGRPPAEPLVAKVIRRQPYGHTPHLTKAAELLRSARREVHALHLAAGPGVPKVEEDRLECRPPMIIMTRLEGSTLAQLIADRGPLSSYEAFELVLDLLRILDRLHRVNWTHGDINPDNVLYDTGRRPNLLDFGASQGPGHPLTGSWILGRHRYCAPEHLVGATLSPPWSCSGTWSDIHQLACLVLFSMTGQEAFRMCGANEQYEREYLPELAKWSSAPGIDKVHSWRWQSTCGLDEWTGVLARWLEPSQYRRTHSASAAIKELKMIRTLS